jgi:bifunctional UDP-N-acetylglucosamine pyrophosphorylase/glucosamine-1-phosphate N-acetyltransferase
MQAFILAAGEGTRLQPLTLSQSKAMLPIANRPILSWIITLIKQHVDEIFVVARKEQTDILEHFKEKVKFVYQDRPLGTGHALALCESIADDEFLVINSDVITSPQDIAGFVKQPAPTLASHRVEQPKEYGVLLTEGNNVLKIQEKTTKPASNLINAGIYLLTTEIFPLLKKLKKSPRGEYELTDALINLQHLRHYELNKWIHIGLPWHLLDANRFVLEQWGSQISSKAEIRSGAYIEEPVAIGDGAIIGPNCFIRKHSAIGKNCKVGNAVEIKNSIIMDNSFVSHLSYVGDSIIGRNCNIAAGTIFANLRLDEKPIKMMIKNQMIDSGRTKLGGVVGDGARFGVNCTIMPGKKIAPGLLIPPCSIIKKDIEHQPNLASWKRILT